MSNSPDFEQASREESNDSRNAANERKERTGLTGISHALWGLIEAYLDKLLEPPIEDYFIREKIAEERRQACQEMILQVLADTDLGINLFPDNLTDKEVWVYTRGFTVADLKNMPPIDLVLTKGGVQRTRVLRYIGYRNKSIGEKNSTRRHFVFSINIPDLLPEGVFLPEQRHLIVNITFY